MDGSYVLNSETTKKTDLCIFCQKGKKSANFSSSSTGREKLIDLSNKITRWIIEKYYWFKRSTVSFNEYYKPYTLQAQTALRKIDKKHKEHRTENNEAKSSVLVEQDRRSIRQKSNGNRRT